MIKPAPDSCHLLLDSRLANEEVQKNPYTYNNIREVLSDGALNAATVEHPVTVYIAPGIYWLEDPQSEVVIVREDPKDLYPYGCKVNCANLKLVGLSENPEDVVIAANVLHATQDLRTTLANVQSLLAPGGTPDAVVQRMNAEVNRALASPPVVEAFQKGGIASLSGTPEQFAAFIRAEIEQYAAVIRKAGITLDT